MKLYSVIMFNSRDMEYAVIGTNYSEAEAKALAKQLPGGFTVEQGNELWDEDRLSFQIEKITGGKVKQKV